MKVTIFLLIILAILIYMEEKAINNKTNFSKVWKDRWLSRRQNEKRNNL